MVLFPKAIKIPALYATEEQSEDEKKIPIKLFNPYGVGTFYIIEYDPDTKMAFGLTDLNNGMSELGYISVQELMDYRWKGMPWGKIERDSQWDKNTTLATVNSKLATVNSN